MRVIAGRARGRRLRTPTGRGTRPTPDRVREALFASLADVVVGARVADLWAGSGALAIEALSRGAARAVLVERDRRALQAIRTNLAELGLADQADVVAGDVVARAATLPAGPFGLVLADPPYDTPAEVIWGVLTELHAAAALAPGCQIVVERSRHHADPGAVPDLLAWQRTRSYGDTVLWFLTCRVPGPGSVPRHGPDP